MAQITLKNLGGRGRWGRGPCRIPFILVHHFLKNQAKG